jgi:hypothetical protein
MKKKSQQYVFSEEFSSTLIKDGLTKIKHMIYLLKNRV